MTVPFAVRDAIDGLLAPLLGTLERVVHVQRRFHPPLAAELVAELAPGAEAVAAPLHAVEATPWPEDLHVMRDRLVDAARQTVEMITAFVAASRSGDHPVEVFRVLRRFARVQETLYPLSSACEAVSRWFLEPARRHDDALVARLRDGARRDDDVRVGVLHASNERTERGGFSLYVPEQWDGRSAMPLVVALHGGGGHGRDFLWSWVRDARSRGVLVLSPTARDRTWSVMGGEDVDAGSLYEMVAAVAAQYAIDPTRVLLTGMSDGATYTLVCGLYEDMPFTHLAPACGTLHPFVLVGGALERAKDRPIYVIQGALDWMFPLEHGRVIQHLVATAGARVVYREIGDLSHTYPRDENPTILDWLIDGRAPDAVSAWPPPTT